MNANKRYAMKVTGFTQVDNKMFDAQPFLTPIAFGVLMRMVRMIEGYGNDDKAMSNTFLQKNCNMSKNTVSKAVGELVEFGFLIQDAQQRKTAIYTLNYENIANFDAKKHGQNLASQNLASQNMTIRFPKSDPELGQNMGSSKENINKNSLNKNNRKTAVVEKPKTLSKKQQADLDRKTLVNSLFAKWLELSGQKITASEKRLSHINARLDKFTADDIIEAMTYVATDKWHVEQGHNKIELAVRSVEQLENKLIAARAAAKKSASNKSQSTYNRSPQSRATDPLAVNAKWGDDQPMTDAEKREWAGTPIPFCSDSDSDDQSSFDFNASQGVMEI